MLGNGVQSNELNMSRKGYKDMKRRHFPEENVNLTKIVREEEVLCKVVSPQVIEEGCDTGFVHIPTQLYDTLVNKETGEKEIIHNGVSNLIVIGFGFLVASLLKGGFTQSFPISYWAVGEGEGAFWDDLTQEQRQSKSLFSLTSLYNETFRVITTNVFIDENDIEIFLGPTNRLEIRAIFGPDVTGGLREFGIFGGTATSSLGSGLMIDHKSHQVIHINETIGLQNVLIRALRLTL